MNEVIGEEPNLPRRSLRLALSELNESSGSPSTPKKNVNVEEVLVMQRGPRKKPITWSPLDYERLNVATPLFRFETT
ncbi:hypothetical protein ABEB36_005273 [Hypothenemus hampei]|uniref:Uncharacterized protein n=1 Tax=Hypothenemus hampei TaxID=57062 RepID=A0ABD1EXP1_HYPHA